MPILVFAILILICAIILVYAVDRIPNIDPTLKAIIGALILLLAVVVILDKAGVI